VEPCVGARRDPGQSGGASLAGSSFGTLFRITTAGESHGVGNVVIIDGCPPGIPLSVEDLRHDLERRRPGQSHLVSQRKEPDEAELLSGVFEGRTTGTSIAILVRNQDARSRDYAALASLYRPGHADYTYEARYGLRDPRGGGRASARETVSRVAAGVVAKKLIAEAFGGEVLAYVTQIGPIRASIERPVQAEAIERLPSGEPNLVRCPDPAAAAQMRALIEAVRKDQDSIGGVAEIVARGVPAGLGDPVFDKLSADLAKALMSIPAVKGIEVGAGFGVAELRGSECNDIFVRDEGGVRTETNRHGGLLGGISSGMPILLRAAIKPTSSLPREQRTIDREGSATVVRTKGRHDPCLLPRFVPVAEAMVALVLADHWLRLRALGHRA